MQLDKLLGKDVEKDKSAPDVGAVEDTAFQNDGEGIPAPEDVERTWYGKKERKAGLRREKSTKKNQKVPLLYLKNAPLIRAISAAWTPPLEYSSGRCSL